MTKDFKNWILLLNQIRAIPNPRTVIDPISLKENLLSRLERQESVEETKENTKTSLAKPNRKLFNDSNFVLKDLKKLKKKLTTDFQHRNLKRN